MSAYPPQQPQPRPRDMTEIRARRERSRQRSRIARLDVMIGVAVAVILLIVSPGLAMSGIIALLALLAIGVSIAVPAYKRRRAERNARPPAPRRR